ncbi:hypothetical protein CY0110_18217 [Crocosphaera chwakensis CCY0110]|uniref:Uncharacterized protein n=1 Tax=Crocosphaera chwakensis CCY0110 TaxID=391612 RepID=A3IIX5_9CHRO|nr:hypothetical protein CY0110_18217 [Crocosphaera chwakensis CCY0110]
MLSFTQIFEGSPSLIQVFYMS